MPITVPVDHDERISFEDFMCHVEAHLDVEDIDSLAAVGWQFRALANNPDLVAEHFNTAIKHYLDGKPLSAYSPQSVMLGRGRGFYIRANIWTPLKLAAEFRSQEERIFSYRNTHDHNFSFMTVGYFGPGYATDLYQYDPSRVQGYIGESVDLQFVERTHLPCGKVMVYREKVDVHTQYPPEVLSISLNILVKNSRTLGLDQYFFDPITRKITDLPEISSVHKRASIVAMAGSVGNPETLMLLEDLVRRAPCQRVRAAAVLASARLPHVSSGDRQRIFEYALDDKQAIVRDKSRWCLDQLSEHPGNTEGLAS